MEGDSEREIDQGYVSYCRGESEKTRYGQNSRQHNYRTEGRRCGLILRVPRCCFDICLIICVCEVFASVFPFLAVKARSPPGLKIVTAQRRMGPDDDQLAVRVSFRLAQSVELRVGQWCMYCCVAEQVAAQVVGNGRDDGLDEFWTGV